MADFNNFWHAASARKKLHANRYSFAYLTSILSLHYLVKCSNCTCPFTTM